MGSVNPVIILPEALKLKGDDWAKTYAGSITLGSGQFCTNPGLLLAIKSDDLTQFIENLSKEIVKIEPTCMLHPNIICAYESKKATMQSQQGLKTTTDLKATIETNYGRQAITTVDGLTFLNNPKLHQEVFGPFSMVVQCDSMAQLIEIVSKLEGQLTGTMLSENKEVDACSELVSALQTRVGRIIFNGVPTGVEVCPSMVHGGPYPASTDSRFTAVGINSIKRWVRPFSYQNWPDALLPDALKNDNRLNISRLVNGIQTKNKL
jgi:NADP-dependent aldehyde dehydrogenase